MKILIIDDLRTFDQNDEGKDTLVYARTFDEGIRQLMTGTWDELYLDHDLGSENPKETGYDILCFLEENNKYLPGRIILITMNSVGRTKMARVIERLYPIANKYI